MKKIVIITSLVLVIITGALYLSKDVIMDQLGLKQAYGVIVYGNEVQTKDNVQLAIKCKAKMEQLSVKKEKEQLIIKASDVKTLMSLDLIHKVDKEELTKISDLTFEKDKKYLWDKTDSSNKETEYQGNLIIGDGRCFANNYLIVQDNIYEQMQGESYQMLILNCKENPKNDLQKYKGYKQLTSIKS